MDKISEILQLRQGGSLTTISKSTIWWNGGWMEDTSKRRRSKKYILILRTFQRSRVEVPWFSWFVVCLHLTLRILWCSKQLNIIHILLSYSFMSALPPHFHFIDILKVSKLEQAIVNFINYWCDTKILADLSSHLFASNFRLNMYIYYRPAFKMHSMFKTEWFINIYF